MCKKKIKQKEAPYIKFYFFGKRLNAQNCFYLPHLGVLEIFAEPLSFFVLKFSFKQIKNRKKLKIRIEKAKKREPFFNLKRSLEYNLKKWGFLKHFFKKMGFGK